MIWLTTCRAELEAIVNRALVKDKDQRYQNVGELQRDLKRLKQNLDFEFQKELPEHTHSRESAGIPTAHDAGAFVDD